MDPKKRTGEIFKVLRKQYPTVTTALSWENPVQLAVATILSAQCTDTKVNEVSRGLFKKYRTASDFANADIAKLEDEIHATGFFHQKAKSIINCCKAIMENFSGQVPDTMEELTSLPGIGRKTANVILGAAFGIPGIVVDTHVKRLAARWRLTGETDPDKIEFDLQKLLPKKEWSDDSHRMIYFGREICEAKKPKCGLCPIEELCPWEGKNGFMRK